MAGRRWIAFWLVVAVATAGMALRLQPMHGINRDAAIYLVYAENLLDGARLYVDVIDFNPPAIHFISIIARLLGTATGLSPIPAFLLLIWTSILAAAALSWALAAPLDPPAHRTLALLGAVWAWAVTLLVLRAFGEREHIMIVATTPLLLLHAFPGGRQSRALCAASGLLAAVGLASKPHFLLLPLGALALTPRARWRDASLRTAWLAASAALLVYALVVVACYRAPLTDLGDLAALYEMKRLSGRAMTALVAVPAGILLVLVAAAWLFRRDTRGDCIPGPLLGAAVAAIPLCLMQGRGYDYHLLPVAVLGPVAAVAVATSVRRARVIAACCAVAFAAWGTWFFSFWKPYDSAAAQPRIARVLRSIEPHSGQTRPTLFTLSRRIEDGTPHALWANARWTAPVPSIWFLEHASRETRDTGRPSFDPREQRLLDRVLDALERDPPDLLLVPTGALARANMEQTITGSARARRLLACYTPRAVVADLEVRALTRTPPCGP